MKNWTKELNAVTLDGKGPICFAFVDTHQKTTNERQNDILALKHWQSQAFIS